MDSELASLSSLQPETRAQRREFLKRLAMVAGSSALLAELPWWSPLRAAPVSDSPSDRVRLGVIGVGSRGSFLLANLLRTPGVEVAALCDDYPPHLEAALAKVKGARGFSDHRQMLDMPGLDGVLIAVPLFLHARMCLDAFAAGKHVFCEKSLAYSIEECQTIADAHRGSSKVFQIGHQRMFSPVFLRALELIRDGQIGQITQIRAYWHRNGNWRNPVPATGPDPSPFPSLERRLNWRLYLDYSRGLMTELASHHMQVANWFLGARPVSCAGYGSINYWKDGREVYDNVNLVYRYDNGTQVVYDSLISNRFYGMEVQIMGPQGTIEGETGKIFSENPPPAPGIVQLINEIEHGFFDAVPIGGPSWVPELKKDTRGSYLVREQTADDGTAISMAAFANAIRAGKPIPGMMEQACRAGVSVLMGHNAMEQQKEIAWPEGFRE
ncbi:MAG: Gfo/Idh/MocA family protein [Terracidiphilus sp.]